MKYEDALRAAMDKARANLDAKADPKPAPRVKPRFTVFNRAAWEKTAPADRVRESRGIPDHAIALHLEECRNLGLDPYTDAGLVWCELCGAQVTYPLSLPTPPAPHRPHCSRYVGPVGTHDVMPGELAPLGYFLRVCNDCGAHVVDRDLHERFHARLRGR